MHLTFAERLTKNIDSFCTILFVPKKCALELEMSSPASSNVMKLKSFSCSCSRQIKGGYKMLHILTPKFQVLA